LLFLVVVLALAIALLALGPTLSTVDGQGNGGQEPTRERGQHPAAGGAAEQMAGEVIEAVGVHAAAPGTARTGTTSP
jgi:hypothetical protein